MKGGLDATPPPLRALSHMLALLSFAGYGGQFRNEFDIPLKVLENWENPNVWAWKKPQPLLHWRLQT